MAKSLLTPDQQAVLDKFMKGEALWPREATILSGVTRTFENAQADVKGLPKEQADLIPFLQANMSKATQTRPAYSPTAPIVPPGTAPTTPTTPPPPTTNPYQYPTDPRAGGPSDKMPAVFPGGDATAPQMPQVNVDPNLLLNLRPQAPLVGAERGGLVAPSPLQTVQTPQGGIELGTGPGARDEGKLLAEAELQKGLRQNVYDQQVGGRAGMLQDLSGLLIKQQQAALADKMPGIYEDMNTRGLLRSSGLGERVNTEAAQLARQTSEQLAQQGLADRGAAINDISAINEAYLGGRGTALQRRVSVEDYQKQLDEAKAMGAAAMPASPSGKGGSIGGAVQGGLGGAQVGAATGKPGGAAGGAVVGTIGGMLQGRG